MSKLYLFAIGGSGSRVVRSLVMLMSAGVELNATKIKLMIIDPDRGGGNVREVLNILSAYKTVNRDLVNQPNDFQNRFCYIPIEPMIPGNFYVTGVDELDSKRRDAGEGEDREKEIRVAFNEAGMNEENKALFQALYADDERGNDVKNGSLGRQHVGALGITKLLDSVGFRAAFADFAEGDRIFIVSSIFGGTGASGFPMLLRKLVGGVDNSLQNKESLIYAQKGAIILFPYFQVAEEKNSPIDGQLFTQKKITTLEYYQKNLQGLARLYYLSDRDHQPQYNHSLGGEKQKNPAHLVEFLAATAVIDFMEMADRTGETQYMEYRMGRYIERRVTFDDLASITRNLVRKPMTQFLLMVRYIQLDAFNSDTAWYRDLGSFFREDAYREGLELLKNFYILWLEDLRGSLEQTSRSFAPFILEPPAEEPFKFFPETSNANLEAFRTTLNKIVQKVKKNGQSNVISFMELFWRATRKMVEGESAPKFHF